MTKCSKYLDQSQNNDQSLDKVATGHHVVWGDDVVDIVEEMKNTKEGEDDEEEEEEDKEDVKSDDLTVEEEMEIQRRWVPMNWFSLVCDYLYYHTKVQRPISSASQRGWRSNPGLASVRRGGGGQAAQVFEQIPFKSEICSPIT